MIDGLLNAHHSVKMLWYATEDSRIIADLVSDEEKHRYLLESIYSAMTGENPSPPT